MSTREHEELNQLIPPTEQRHLVRRALAAEFVRQGADAQVRHPSDTADRNLGLRIRMARRSGLSAIEVGHVIDEAQEEVRRNG